MNPNLNPDVHEDVVDALTEIICAIDDIAIDCRFELNKCNIEDGARDALFKHINTIHDQQSRLVKLLLDDGDGNDKGFFVVGTDEHTTTT